MSGIEAVLLDADTLGGDVDLTPLRKLVAELRVYGQTRPQQLRERLAGADLVLTNKVVIPDWALKGRRGVLVLATGTDNIDLEAAERLGVPVMNVTDYGAGAVAQHTLMLILALAGRLPRYQRDLAGGAWQASSSFCLLHHPVTQLTGRHLVLVGSGSIGRSVASLAEGFGMQVSFAARPGALDDARPRLEMLLPQADVVSFHCPLNSHTRHLLNAECLTRIRPGCLVVNCARGGVIDELAALQALRDGRLGGLGVDVLPEEPPRNGHPLLDALQEPLNLLVTPHNAWISPEARQNIVTLTAANIRRLLN